MTFAEYITSRLTVPFAWGSNDCLSFVLDWVEVVKNRNYRAEYGHWESQQEAEDLLEIHGGLQRVLDECFTRLDPALASDGDIGLIGRTVYFFNGAWLVCPGADGLTRRDRTEAECAWCY